MYLLYENLLPPQRSRHAPKPRKEKRRKELGDEKMEEKKYRGTRDEEHRKKQGAGLQPNYPGHFGRLLQPARIIWRAHSCNSPGPQGENICICIFITYSFALQPHKHF